MKYCGMVIGRYKIGRSQPRHATKMIAWLGDKKNNRDKTDTIMVPVDGGDEATRVNPGV